LAADFDWKKTAEPVMQLYTEATDGSYIEHKESAIVWHHHEADPDFGSCQAKELLDHLENVLANEPVVVKRGQHIVEVNPQVSGEPNACMPCFLRSLIYSIDMLVGSFQTKRHRIRIDLIQSSPHPLHACDNRIVNQHGPFPCGLGNPRELRGPPRGCVVFLGAV